jgi:hypothetical protein
LRTLLVAADDQEADEGLPAVCLLSGLRELYVWCSSGAKQGLLPQLTELQLLTALTHIGPIIGLADSELDGDGMGDGNDGMGDGNDGMGDGDGTEDGAGTEDDDWMGDGHGKHETVELICQVS